MRVSSHCAASISAAGLPAAARRAASPGQTLAIVCVGMVLANLDLFIVNVGLPAIQHDFHNARLENMSWVLNGYAIAYAALLVFFGRLAERHRRDLSFLLGVALFTLASGACAAAQGLVSLTLFRIVQAAGAALMTPTSLGLLLAVFPPERRNHAVRVWTAVGGFGAALGPLVGGLLVTFDWRWIFLVNVPIGLVALWIGWFRLPHIDGHPVAPPSPIAAALVTGGIAAVTLAIVKGGDWGWASPEIVGSFAAAAILLGLFVRHCLRAKNPFVDPALFRIAPYAGATLVMAPYSMAFGAMLLSVALWEQSAWGWSAMRTGLVIAPGPLLVPTVSLLLAGRLIQRFGAAPIITAGVLLFAGGLLAWANFVGLEPSATAVLAGMIPIGVGVGLTFPTLMGVAASSLPPSSFATGSAVINMVRQASLAIGVALFVAVAGAGASPQARADGFHRGWKVMIVIILISLIPNLALIHRRRRA